MPDIISNETESCKLVAIPLPFLVSRYRFLCCEDLVFQLARQMPVSMLPKAQTNNDALSWTGQDP